MFVLSYFRTDPEALHLALSEDGYTWTALNDNEPILRGEVGDESLRDPFLIEDQGGTYHMLSTDGWHSEYIVHAESDDLIEWSDQERIPVMTNVEGTHNSWAPEAYYDREAGVYRIIWSSTVDPTGGQDDGHRIWMCSTPDFETFSPASCFVDPGYSVIDACVAHDGEEYIMAIKDERGENDLDTDHKDIKIATAANGGGPFGPFSEPVTPAPVEGPTVFHNGEEWLLLYDHFMEDYYGGSRSEDGREFETCTDELSFPDDVRHGSVIEIPDALADDLRAEYGI